MQNNLNGFVILPKNAVRDYAYVYKTKRPLVIYKTKKEALKYAGDDVVLLPVKIKDKSTFDYKRGVLSLKENIQILVKDKSGLIENKKILSLNTRFLDALTRHQVTLMNYAKGLANQANSKLQEFDSDIKSIIYSRFEDFDGIQNKADIQNLNVSVNKILSVRQKAWDELNIKEDMEELTEKENDWYAFLLSTFLPYALKIGKQLTKKTIHTIINSKILGDTIDGWIENVVKKDLVNIENALRTAVTTGKSISDVLQAVNGTKAMNNRDGALSQSQSAIDLLYRTLTNSVAGQTRDGINVDNSVLFDKELYVAVLDNRTTQICRSLDGNLYDVGKPPIPPMHWACRSKRVPLFYAEAQERLSLKPELLKQFQEEYKDNQSTETYAEWIKSRFKQYVGGKPDDISYPEWLSRQSNDFQDYVLGKSNGQKFRDGDINVERFNASGIYGVDWNEYTSREY